MHDWLWETGNKRYPALVIIYGFLDLFNTLGFGLNSILAFDAEQRVHSVSSVFLVCKKKTN